MKYITFTHVDAVTGIPVTIAPARNGPTAPKGARFGFALESQYPTSVPIFYGTILAADDDTAPGILSVITKAEYDAAEAAEMEARTDKLRIKVVSMRQARIALSRAGVLSAAEAALAGMDGQSGEEARIEWDFAVELRREHPLVAALGGELGLDEAAIDELFAQAAQID